MLRLGTPLPMTFGESESFDSVGNRRSCFFSILRLRKIRQYGQILLKKRACGASVLLVIKCPHPASRLRCQRLDVGKVPTDGNQSNCLPRAIEELANEWAKNPKFTKFIKFMNIPVWCQIRIEPLKRHLDGRN